MKPTSLLSLLSATALLVLVDAREEYVALIPNGANVAGVAALGHVDTSGGGARNAFGKAFADSGLEWTTELCQADSDGDGQTNGQELGDPCCVWKQGATPQYSTGVSAPGDATSKADASLWASISCSGSSAATTTTTPASTSSSPSATSASPSTTTTATPTTSASAVAQPWIATGVAVGVMALAQL